MLTTTCPNECPWCFARPKMDSYGNCGIPEMGWDDFLKVVDFYERSGVRHMALLGGEPTRHSRILDILAHLGSRSFSIQVGTNGIVPPSIVDAVSERRFSHLYFFLNSTSYFDYDPDKRNRVDYFLAHAGYPVKLSYTITERDVARPSVNPVLDRMALITRRSLLPHLQFQVAVPCSGNASFVPLEKYEALVDLLARWSMVLRKNRFSCALDCHSMPACILPAKENRPFPYRSACDSFMIDIGPALEVWPCFPLSEEIFRLEEFGTFSDIQRRFRGLISSSPLLYEDRCGDCEHRRNRTCHCGCWGFQHLRRPARHGLEA
jgi:MoaA/NifB/PqqE/SkfB family radical SAM enzyme